MFQMKKQRHRLMMYLRMGKLQEGSVMPTGSQGETFPNMYRSLPAQSWRNLASKEGYMVQDPEFVKKYGEDVYGPEGFRWSPKWETLDTGLPGGDIAPPDFDFPFPPDVDFTPDDSYLPWWMKGPGSPGAAAGPMTFF